MTRFPGLTRNQRKQQLDNVDTLPRVDTSESPPEENPRLTKLSLTMYDEPYVPHVPVGLPHCRVVTRPRGNKREYTHTHTHTHTSESSCARRRDEMALYGCEVH